MNYEPANHEKMVRIRQEKVDRIADRLPPTEIFGEDSGDILVIGWGGTFGSIHAAAKSMQNSGRKVSAVHLRYINPLPNDLEEIMSRFKRVVIPELNLGQLSRIIRDRYLVDAIPINKVQGRPFLVGELIERIEQAVAEKNG